MTKPDDIPQDVWETANALSSIIADDSGWLPSFDVFAAIARAIMAEREACAALLEAIANERKAEWEGFIASGSKGPATNFEAFYRSMAEAIRNRGPA